MKKILLFLVLISVITSCYDDFRLDNEYSSVAFSSADGGSNQFGVLWRTVVKGEGLKLDAGIYLAGVLENKKERWADYEIDPSLLVGTGYTLLPPDYYTLSNSSRFVIKSGETVGKLSITLDSLKFVNDVLTTKMNYAIPFKLVRTSEDSILSTQSSQIFVIKYINQYEGFYNQKGTFETVSPDGITLNSGIIGNVITGKTLFLDSLEINGSMNLLGPDYKMKLRVNADNTVSLEYSPNLNVDNSPKNIALDATVSAPSVSAWENANGIKDGIDPTSSADRGANNIAFGNWPNPETWNYVQYDFGGSYVISKSDIYWWADSGEGDGGIGKPYNTYLEYWDVDTATWKLLYNNNTVNGTAISEANYGNKDNAVVNSASPKIGTSLDRYNTTIFDVITTSKVRVYFKGVDSSGILEWKVWGIPAPSGYEASPIATITENGSNTYDPKTGTFILNYRVNYTFEDYHTDVTTKMVWRNRIRDGVNEWR